MGDNMFRLKDRFGRDLCLGMTHEEVMTAIARGELRSYKQLPQIWYQIQTKFRDEPRPKSGLLRVRQFIMKDSYTFDIDAGGAGRRLRETLRARTAGSSTRCGLEYMVVEAHSGAMGGSQSHEFMVASDAGEDFVVDVPELRLRGQSREGGRSMPRRPQRPIRRAISRPKSFTRPAARPSRKWPTSPVLPETSQMKSLVMVADGKPVLVLLRGDHQLSETKFARQSGRARKFAPRIRRRSARWFGADAGSLGPVGVSNMRILADEALAGRRNMIAGANKNDYHLRNVTPGEDFKPSSPIFGRSPRAMPASVCGAAAEDAQDRGDRAHFQAGIQVFGVDGTARARMRTAKKSRRSWARYGIGIERILSAAIELYHDKDGMVLPPSIAPFTVVVTPVNIADAAQLQAARTDLPRLPRRRASTRCSTIATSGPA